MPVCFILAIREKRTETEMEEERCVEHEEIISASDTSGDYLSSVWLHLCDVTKYGSKNTQFMKKNCL